MDLMRDATVLLWISPMLAPHVDVVQASRVKLSNLLWYGLFNMKEIPRVRAWLQICGLAEKQLRDEVTVGVAAQLWLVVALSFLYLRRISEWKQRYWVLMVTVGFVVLTDLLWASEHLIVRLEPGWFTDRSLHYIVAVLVAVTAGFTNNLYEPRLAILLIELCNYNLLKFFSLGAPWSVGIQAYIYGLAWAVLPIASAAFIIAAPENAEAAATVDALAEPLNAAANHPDRHV